MREEVPVWRLKNYFFHKVGQESNLSSAFVFSFFERLPVEEKQKTHSETHFE